MWYFAKVEVAFLLVALCDFMIVGNDYKVFGTQRTYLTDTCYEMYLGKAWKGAQDLAFR